MSIGRALARRAVPRPLRNWIRSPGRSLRWVGDEIRHRLGFDRTVRMRDDWVIRCHPAADRLAYRAQRHDPDQRAELEAFVSRCRPGMVLFDLGAHFGVFSLAALRFGGPDARAVAVDPSPAAQRMIRLHARLNGVADRLTPVQAGVAATEGEVEFVAAGVIAAGYFTPPRPDHGARDRTRVRAVTVDALVAELGIVPTHLKIDVEGCELDALRGAPRVLAAEPPPLVFLELHVDMLRASGHDPADALALLRAADYHTFAGDGSRLPPDAILSQPLVRLIARRTG